MSLWPRQAPPAKCWRARCRETPIHHRRRSVPAQCPRPGPFNRSMEADPRRALAISRLRQSAALKCFAPRSRLHHGHYCPARLAPSPVPFASARLQRPSSIVHRPSSIGLGAGRRHALANVVVPSHQSRAEGSAGQRRVRLGHDRTKEASRPRVFPE
jgi:hypothetical protein